MGSQKSKYRPFTLKLYHWLCLHGCTPKCCYFTAKVAAFLYSHALFVSVPQFLVFGTRKTQVNGKQTCLFLNRTPLVHRSIVTSDWFVLGSFLRIFKIYEACLHPCMHIKFGLYIHILSYKNFGFFFFWKVKNLLKEKKTNIFSLICQRKQR